MIKCFGNKGRGKNLENQWGSPHLGASSKIKEGGDPCARYDLHFQISDGW